MIVCISSKAELRVAMEWNILLQENNPCLSQNCDHIEIAIS